MLGAIFLENEIHTKHELPPFCIQYILYKEFDWWPDTRRCGSEAVCKSRYPDLSQLIRLHKNR
jgi:hypothetical protein